MSAKCLVPSQCDLLHEVYGPSDCCLCKANAHIRELEVELEAKIDRLKELIEAVDGVAIGAKRGKA